MKKFRSSYPGTAFLVPLVCLLLAVSGCVGPLSREQRERGAELPKLQNIAVLPMDRASVRPGQERATCALSDTVFEADETSPEDARTLSQVLSESVQGDPRFQVVPEGRCIGFLNAILNADVKTSQLRLIQAMGEELGADAVLYGKLFRFEERVGGPYAVKKPASVAFTLHLIRVADGSILWRSSFDETQQPLSENLFKAKIYRKSGMRWLTAQELSRFGVNEAIRELNSRLP